MKEVEYQRFLEILLESKHKKVKYGITDITTENEHIEIKKWRDYKSALGQIISYNTCDNKDKLSVYFFGFMDVNKKIEIIDLFKKNGINVYEFDFIVKELYINDSKEFVIRNIIKDNFKIGNDKDYVKICDMKKVIRNNKIIKKEDLNDLQAIVENIFQNLKDDSKNIIYIKDSKIDGKRICNFFSGLTLIGDEDNNKKI